MKKFKTFCLCALLIVSMQAPVSANYWVTPYGECYHRASCRYVRNNYRAKEISNSKAYAYYRPCKVCIGR